MKDNESQQIQAIRINLCEQISEHLRKCDMTKATLAELTGTSRANITQLLNPNGTQKISSLINLASTCGLNVSLVVSNPNQRDTNQRKKASQYFINKMDYLERKIAQAEQLKDFFRDDSFHNNPAKNHIMIKYGVPLTRTLTMTGKDYRLIYEFLIEYHINKPSEGIYYGCKIHILSDSRADIGLYDLIDTEFEPVKDKITTVLNNTFPRKDFSHRLLETDNASLVSLKIS